MLEGTYSSEVDILDYKVQLVIIKTDQVGIEIS